MKNYLDYFTRGGKVRLFNGEEKTVYVSPAFIFLEPLELFFDKLKEKYGKKSNTNLKASTSNNLVYSIPTQYLFTNPDSFSNDSTTNTNSIYSSNNYFIPLYIVKGF